MDVVGVPLLGLIVRIVDLYIWVVVIGVVLSWLVAFNVLNQGNRFVYLVADFINRITEPALRPIRNTVARLLPNLGGFDISPLVLILILWAVQDLLIRLIIRLG